MKMHGVFYFIYFILVLSTRARDDEPRCSKYDFEEKVLEKQVRIEFQIERLKLEFAEAIAEMKETKNMMEQYVHTIDARTSSIEDKYDFAALEQRINETLANQVSELKSMKEAPTIPRILFKARSLQKTTYDIGETLVFTHVYSEHGKGYNPTNGSFVVPVSGTYLIGVTLCLSSNGCVLGITVNGSNIFVEYIRYQSGTPCFSYSTIEVLLKGQEVVVKPLPGGSACTISQSEAYRWNTLYALLIHV